MHVPCASKPHTLRTGLAAKNVLITQANGSGHSVFTVKKSRSGLAFASWHGIFSSAVALAKYGTMAVPSHFLRSESA
jgi:hypothetical protein